MSLCADSILRLPPGHRLKWQDCRQAWVLLGPERMLELDETGHAILSGLQGQSIAALSRQLAASYGVPAADIQQDVLAFATELNEKGYLRHELPTC